MESKLINCLKNNKSDYVPIWFMRQAGRYLPEFRKIREKNPNFIQLCLNERLAAEISLQPIRRFDLDAVIIFSDILMVPYGLGQKVEFKIFDSTKLKRIAITSSLLRISFSFQNLQKIRK